LPVAERIHAAITAVRIPALAGDIAITLSIGIAEVGQPTQDESVAQVISRADEAVRGKTGRAQRVGNLPGGATRNRARLSDNTGGGCPTKGLIFVIEALGAGVSARPPPPSA
jgi:GGDEF domain-containing protein